MNLESLFVRVFSAGFAGWEERKTMKVSKFTDAQKAFILKQGTDGMPVADFPQGRDQPGDVFQLEEAVRRIAADRDEAVEAARGRERAAEEAGGGPEPRPRDAAGRHPPKTVRPGRKRELAAHLCMEWDVSIRRACRVLEFDTSTYHYKARRRDQAGIEARIRDICQTRVRYGYRARACAAASGGLGDQPEANAQDLQRVGHAAEEQDTEASGESQASGRSPGSHWTERCLGHGLRA